VVSRELSEHLGYHLDSTKVGAYRAALAANVSPDRTVLDLGSGTGLLGFLALEGGAKHVHAVESGAIIDIAQRTFAAAGYRSQVSMHQTSSTELELDELVDVVVCDQIGGFVHDAGVLSYFADARERLATSEATYIPSSFDFYCVPIRHQRLRDSIDRWIDAPSSAPVAHIHKHSVNTEHYFTDVADVALLGESACIGTRASHDESAAVMSGEMLIDETGQLDGIAGYFVAHMAPGVTLTNDPASPSRMNRWCNFYPVEEPIQVQAGDRVGVEIDLRPASRLMSWTITVTSESGDRRVSRHSTLLGDFVSKRDLSHAAPSVSTAVSDAVAAALDLADGNHNRSEIIDAVFANHAGAFTSRRHCASILQAVLGQLSR